MLKSRNSKSKVKDRNSFLESLQQARANKLSLTKDATIENSDKLKDTEYLGNQTNSESEALQSREIKTYDKNKQENQ